MQLTGQDLLDMLAAPSWLDSWRDAKGEHFLHVGTMSRTSRMFKRNGGPKRSMYKTLWDVPRMRGDDTMMGMKR